MNKYLQRFTALLAITSLIICTACSLLDFNGDGEINAAKFFQGLEVSVVLVDPETGETWSIATTENGIDIQGTYIDSHGTTWVLGKGPLSVKAVTRQGNTINIQPTAKQ